MIDGGHQFQWLTAYNRQLMEGHRLDWPGQPSFFKDYSPCTSYPLPLPETLPEMSLFTLSEKRPSRSPLIWNRHSLALQAMGADFEVVLDFDDAAINQTVGFDEKREVGLATVRLHSSAAFLGDKKSFEKNDPEPELSPTSRVSSREVDYPLLHEIHQTSSVPFQRTLSRNGSSSEFYQKISGWRTIPENRVTMKSALDYVESLRRRRSKKNFIKSGASLDIELVYALLGLLKQQGKAISEPAPEIAFLASGIRGLNDGLYLFDWLAGRFALFDDQDRRREVAQASLDQRWLERAALQFLFFADLGSAQEIYGPRSYRYLQIAAGRLGQLLYLGATALGLGCCAVGAFYDRELAQVCLIPENFDPLYLVAVGPVAGGL